jgi:hypothetical protein
MVTICVYHVSVYRVSCVRQSCIVCPSIVYPSIVYRVSVNRVSCFSFVTLNVHSTEYSTVNVYDYTICVYRASVYSASFVRLSCIVCPSIVSFVTLNFYYKRSQYCSSFEIKEIIISSVQTKYKLACHNYYRRHLLPNEHWAEDYKTEIEDKSQISRIRLAETETSLYFS